MTITLETSTTPADDVKCWPGVELRNNKHYHDVGPACPINPHPDPERPHRRITSLPGPGDWAPAARWQAGDFVRDNIADLARMDLDDIRATVARGAEQVLDAAARRGTAVHKYAEWRTKGERVPHFGLEADGATPWLAAVDNYLRDHPHHHRWWCEVRCFDPELGIAGTVDVVKWCDDAAAPVVGDRTIDIVDYKTRGKRHDKRASEAAQLGAYARAAHRGYMVDERGVRHRVDWISSLSIVTFCPDGTYAIHEIDPNEAIAAHEGRMGVVENVAWSTTKSQPFDVAATVKARLAATTSEQRNTLAPRWKAAGLPQIADLTVDHWPLADRLLASIEPKPAPAATEYASIEACAAIHDRIERLPEDLRAQVRRSGGGLVNPLAAVVDCQQLADWERLLEPAEAVAARRPGQARLLLDPLIKVNAAASGPLLATFDPRPVPQWTDADLDRCAELVDAIMRGDLYVTDDGTLAVTPDVVAALPKRETTAAAKRIAETIGRPKPARFADVVADVVTFAALRAA